MPNVVASKRTANQSGVPLSSRTRARPVIKSCSTSVALPGFAINRTNMPTLTMGPPLHAGCRSAQVSCVDRREDLRRAWPDLEVRIGVSPAHDARPVDQQERWDRDLVVRL